MRMNYEYTLIGVIVISILTSGCINIGNNEGISRFDLQVIYIDADPINIVEILNLDESSASLLNNDTFSVLIKCNELNKSIEYNTFIINNSLFIEYDENIFEPRLAIGIIVEDHEYIIDFIFNINYSEPFLDGMNIWGTNNTISCKVSYNSDEGLKFDYSEDYKSTTWDFSNRVDILLSFPYNQNFGILLGIEDS